MHVGTQDSPRTDTDFEVLAQLGVDHLCADPPGPWQEWGVDTISRFREKVESYGISLDIINLPISSTGASGSSSPNVLQGPSVERDREIEQICQLIRNASRAGIPRGQVLHHHHRTPPHSPAGWEGRRQALLLQLLRSGPVSAGRRRRPRGRR